MKDSVNNSDIFPFKLDKDTKTLMWAFVIPLIMAGNCIFLQMYLEYESRKQCPEGSKISFSISGDSYGILQYDLRCADAIYQWVYIISGVMIYIFIGLSIALPGILYLRRRSVRQAKLFE